MKITFPKGYEAPDLDIALVWTDEPGTKETALAEARAWVHIIQSYLPMGTALHIHKILNMTVEDEEFFDYVEKGFEEYVITKQGKAAEGFNIPQRELKIISDITQLG